MHKPFLAQMKWESQTAKFPGAKWVSFIPAMSCSFRQYSKNRTENLGASLEFVWNCSYRQAELIIVHGKIRYNILKYFAWNKHQTFLNFSLPAPPLPFKYVYDLLYCCSCAHGISKTNMQGTLSSCCSFPDGEGAQVQWALVCRVQMHEKLDLFSQNLTQLFTVVFSFQPEIFSFSNLGPHSFAGLSGESRIWFLTVNHLSWWFILIL